MTMKEKKSHGVQLLIRTVVKDSEGKIISDSGQKPSKSFVIQFLEFIYALFRITAYDYDATGTDGTERPIWHSTTVIRRQFLTNVGAGSSLHGIVIGTGNTAVTNEDYQLEAQLTQGVGAGNITHGAMDVTDDVAVVGANVDWEVKRAFTNLTGSSITVREAGIYTRTSGGYHCIIRDVLGTPIVVPDKASLTVYYTFRTTV